MMVYDKVIIAADFAELHKVSEFIEGVLDRMDSHARSQMVLAIHELCLNIVEHAYAGAPGSIELEVFLADGQFELQVHDDGPHAYFGTPEIVPPDPNEYPEGGWGLYILHQVMDNINYRRLEAGNEWRLLKNLE